MLRIKKSLLTVAVLATVLVACGGAKNDPPPTTATRPLNDTGVTGCFAPGDQATTCPAATAPDQDAQFGRDAAAREDRLQKSGGGAAGFDFLKLGADGEPLAIQNQDWQQEGAEAEGSRWSCVQDQVTGLTWEIKERGTDSARHFNHTYSWYNPDSNANAGAAGSRNLGACLPEGQCDTLAYIAYVNGLALCGRQNWRLPEVNELLSIVHQDQPAPPLDTHYFPNASLNAYWTSQSVAQVPGKTWYLYFTAGSTGNIDKSGRAHVRLVSDAE